MTVRTARKRTHRIRSLLRWMISRFCVECLRLNASSESRMCWPPLPDCPTIPLVRRVVSPIAGGLYEGTAAGLLVFRCQYIYLALLSNRRNGEVAKVRGCQGLFCSNSDKETCKRKLQTAVLTLQDTLCESEAIAKLILGSASSCYIQLGPYSVWQPTTRTIGVASHPGRQDSAQRYCQSKPRDGRGRFGRVSCEARRTTYSI